MSVVLIPTSSAQHFGKNLAALDGFKVLSPEYNKDGRRHFPDGEVYVRLPATSTEDHVILLHSGMPDPNDGIVELESVLSILKKRGTKHIDIFFTYFPYGMQDSVFEEGEVNMAESILQKMRDYYGVSHFFIIDPHFGGREWMARYSITSLSAVDFLKKEVQKKYPDALFLAPDAGAQRRFGLSGFFKQRNGSFSVSVTNGDEIGRELAGKTVVIVDDLVETGGTLVHIGETCRTYGVSKLIALITHGVLRQGIERVYAAYDECYLTNSIDHNLDQYDLSDFIGRVLQEKYASAEVRG